MNTVAHMLVASAVLARRESPKRNLAVLAGALLPDASMFVFFGWSRIQGWSGEETWNIHYWTEPWQTLGAVSNSFVLFAVLGAIAVWRRSILLAVICAAALLHLGADFPLHADDAHRHFWPLTDWRFFSPVSYWDPAYHGWLGSVIESLCVLVSLSLLWLRFTGARRRGVFIALAIVQVGFLAAQIAWTLNQSSGVS